MVIVIGNKHLAILADTKEEESRTVQKRCIKLIYREKIRLYEFRGRFVSTVGNEFGLKNSHSSPMMKTR